jgi:hypothetical protein
VEGEEIRCWICNESDVLYRREIIDNAEKIVEKGYFEPSGTDVVSLSANPYHTYGGPVRFVFYKEDMGCPVEPMCYIINPDEEDKYVKLRQAKEKYYVDNYYKFFGDKSVNITNLIDAEYGVTANAYIKECEYMGRCSVPTSKVRRIEYWLGQAMYLYDIAPQRYVTCEHTYPAYIDASGYDQWSMYKWKIVFGELPRARRLAQMLGVPFVAKSCFPAIKISPHEWVILNSKNLRRIAEGKDLIIIRPKETLTFDRNDCRC